MAYQIEFAPSAHQQVLDLDRSAQQKVLRKLSELASSTRNEEQHTKRLRRLRMDDFRLIYLELHTHKKILILKIADKAELLHRLGIAPKSTQ